MGSTFLLEYEGLATAAARCAEAQRLEHRCCLAVLWRPLMAWAQQGQLVHIFVGHLAFTGTEQDVRALVAAYGGVARVNRITDRATGRLGGLGFVERADANAARAASTALPGRERAGRALNVNAARPRDARSAGGWG
jgi:cold-inducible RNA-binding protein